MNSLISINSYKDLLKKNHVLRTVYLLIKFRGINLSLKILKNYLLYCNKLHIIKPTSKYINWKLLEKLFEWTNTIK